jgi:excisionase family DNA binding protein
MHPPGKDQQDPEDPELGDVNYFNLDFEIQERPITYSDVESLLEKFTAKIGPHAGTSSGIETKPDADSPSLYSLIEKSMKSSGVVPKALLDQLLTYADVAQRLQCSERHVKKIKARGDLRAAPIQGKVVRFSTEELQRYLSEDAPKRSRSKQR